jgi:hypothetical protein
MNPDSMMDNTLLTQIKNNLLFATSPEQFLLFRLLLACSSLTWAVLLVESIIDNSLVASSPTQNLLNSVMPAAVWMLLHTVQGVFGITGVLVNPRSKLFVIFDSMLAAILWSVTSSVMVVGYLIYGRDLPPVWAAQLTMTMLAVWALFRNKYGR